MLHLLFRPRALHQALLLPDFWPFLALVWVAAWLTWKRRGLGLTLLPEDLLGKASTCSTASSAPQILTLHLPDPHLFTRLT